MTETQMLAMVGPVTSLVVVIAGYIFQNVILNARIGEVRTNLNTLRTDLNTRMAEQNDTIDARIDDLRDTIRAEQKGMADTFAAELRAVRAEMAKNHSELLSALARHDHPVSKP